MNHNFEWFKKSPSCLLLIQPKSILRKFHSEHILDIISFTTLVKLTVTAYNLCCFWNLFRMSIHCGYNSKSADHTVNIPNKANSFFKHLIQIQTHVDALVVHVNTMCNNLSSTNIHFKSITDT